MRRIVAILVLAALLPACTTLSTTHRYQPPGAAGDAWQLTVERKYAPGVQVLTLLIDGETVSTMRLSLMQRQNTTYADFRGHRVEYQCAFSRGGSGVNCAALVDGDRAGQFYF